MQMNASTKRTKGLFVCISLSRFLVSQGAGGPGSTQYLKAHVVEESLLIVGLHAEFSSRGGEEDQLFVDLVMDTEIQQRLRVARHPGLVHFDQALELFATALVCGDDAGFPRIRLVLDEVATGFHREVETACVSGEFERQEEFNTASSRLEEIGRLKLKA